MNVYEPHILLAAAWLLWCVLHGVYISESWMTRVRCRLGSRIAYYRLVYVLFSVFTLAPVVLLQLRIDSPLLRAWPSWLKPLQWLGFLAGLLLLICWGEITVANLILKIVGIGYFIVGAFLEERKLIARFGEAYRRYREEVPMFVPRLVRPIER